MGGALDRDEEVSKTVPKRRPEKIEKYRRRGANANNNLRRKRRRILLLLMVAIVRVIGLFLFYLSL